MLHASGSVVLSDPESVARFGDNSLCNQSLWLTISSILRSWSSKKKEETGGKGKGK